MQAKSLSTFRTQLRHDDQGTVLVNIGDVIEGDEEHLRALARNRLVRLVEDEEPGESVPEPPTSKQAKNKGKR